MTCYVTKFQALIKEKEITHWKELESLPLQCRSCPLEHHVTFITKVGAEKGLKMNA